MKENIRKITYTINKEFDGKTIKEFLIYNGYSQELIKHLKQTTNIYMNDTVYNNQKLKIEIVEIENSDNIVKNKKLPLNILYEDKDMLIVDKPHDMPIHPSQGNYENTLGNAVMYYFRNMNFVYRPITRLDRDTSGICVIAKNKLASAILSNDIKNSNIHRFYIGIVEGNVYDIVLKEYENKYNVKDIVNFKFIIDNPIARANDSTIKREINKEIGKKAVTKVTAFKYLSDKNLSVCKFSLLTGHTHQIRVHMKSIGFPIIGDFLYNEDYRYISRQALHSNEVIIHKPITRELIRVISKLPNDMNNIVYSSLT